MNPREHDVEAMARAIDRIVFHEGSSGDTDPPAGELALISYLNDSFPRMGLTGTRRERLQRRLVRALRIPAPEPVNSWARLEAEVNRRLPNVDPRWRPVVGGAAIILIGVVGLAVWRQRGAVKPAIADLR